jgi:hypothetical protein
MENCILLFHLSTGDNFTMYAMVLHYSFIYKNVHIFCLHRNSKTIKQMYNKYNNIIIHVIQDEKYNGCIVPKNNICEIKNKLINADIISTGMNNDNWNLNPSSNFWRYFYKQGNLDYEIRYKYMDIYRNYEKEKELYNKLVNKYGDKYIFINDHRHVSYNHNYKRPNVKINHELPIFHANINYYNENEKKFDLWEIDFLKNNLFDYCMIIENATEIHITDSSFSCLCPYLNLSKVIKKCIYSGHDYVNYHDSFKDWTILPYQK